jgi:hypothetical protein
MEFSLVLVLSAEEPLRECNLSSEMKTYYELNDTGYALPFLFSFCRSTQ